ncbi:MAG: hypothetical protein WC692_09400 [Erythrobacter sp.]
MLVAWSDRAGRVRTEDLLAALAAYSQDNPSLLARNGLGVATSRPGLRSPPVDPPVAYPFGIAAFTGWLDRDPQPGLSDTRAYLDAFARYGDDTDEHLTGCYAVAIWLPGNGLRLARSPWHAPPLHFAFKDGEIVASSVLRAIFAFGVPRRLNRQRVAQALFLDGARDPAHDWPADDWYEDVRRVPLGTVLKLTPDGLVNEVRRYDPHRIAVAVPQDAAGWVATARDMIDGHARLAARRSHHPAIALSGGLDSPIATEAFLRMRGAGQMPSIVSVRPSRMWDGVTETGKFGDEASRVADFCARHGLEPIFTREGGFDLELQELHRASGVTSPFIGNGGMIMAAHRAAARAGADWFFDAVCGNDTVSADGHWAYPDLLLSGRWGQLRAALGHRAHDPRGMARKCLSLAVLPVLPPIVRQGLLACFSRGPGAVASGASLLRREVVAELGLASTAQANGRRRGRRGAIELAWAASDCGMADLDLGREQLTGLRRRDLFAYRPLIEFCLSLPDAAFLRDGTDRWLARELARGIMPEGQRLETRYGSHNVDWHAYLLARRGDLLESFEHLASHPWLGDMVDSARAKVLLRDLPERTPLDPAVAWPLQFGIIGTIAVARFVAQVEGRNDL